MVSLTAIVPATNDPPTLSICTDAIRVAEGGPEQLLVVRDADRPGPAAARNEGARGASGDVLVFVDADIEIHPDAFARIRRAFAADPELGAVFGSYDDTPAAHGARLGLPQPAAPPRPPVRRRAGRPPSGPGSARSAAMRSSASAASTRSASRTVGRGHRAREAAHAAGSADRARPGDPGDPPEALDARAMVRTDLLAARCPVGRLLVESRGGSSALNLGWRHRLSTLPFSLASSGLARSAALVAAASLGTLVVLNHSFYALLVRRRGEREAVAGSGCTRCTT